MGTTREMRAAVHAEHAVRELSALAGDHGPGPERAEDIARDVRLQALFNDIRYITLQAEVRGAVKGIWVASVNDKKDLIFRPRPEVSPAVLGVCTYHIVVYGTGKHPQYRDGLRLEWPRWRHRPERRYTGTVERLPYRDQLGRVRTTGQVNGLLSRDAKVDGRPRLEIGDDVEFSIAQHSDDFTPRVIAFLVTKVSGAPDDWLLGHEAV